MHEYPFSAKQDQVFALTSSLSTGLEGNISWPRIMKTFPNRIL